MTIKARIIADSISPAGIRLTTFQLRYPRFIHAELMTHRVFSRNASSSRAIPVKKMIEDLRRDPAMPVFWGSNQPGMQAGDELNAASIEACKSLWLYGMKNAIDAAEAMVENGLHKQIANRILEPWGHINVVLTSTSFANFYTLRRHKDAQPEIKALADAMHFEHKLIAPRSLARGEWHLPYIKDEERAEHDLETVKKVSVARCARVSYLTHDGRQTTAEEDAQLYERLVGGMPLHASPAEHQATPDSFIESSDLTPIWDNPNEHGNLHGWRQLRKQLVGEFTPG